MVADLPFKFKQLEVMIEHSKYFKKMLSVKIFDRQYNINDV